MFSLELSLQIRPKLVNQVVNHTNWDACPYAPECRPDTAICIGIVQIRQTTGGDTAQQARPVSQEELVLRAAISEADQIKCSSLGLFLLF